MKNRRNRNIRTLNSYCRLIIQATDLGVPLDDILSETRKYHGDIFAEAVRDRLNSF
jgi:hypothetical protein